MTVGTKSVLFGAHCFFIHPLLVAAAWWKLNGAPLDPRLWCAFFLHDIGYIGKPNMDGVEGEAHPVLGAKIMGFLFDRHSTYWYRFTLCHSRRYAALINQPISRLCIADKLSFALIPRWLYLPMVTATGELQEYMRATREERGVIAEETPLLWLAAAQEHSRRWVATNRDKEEVV